MKAAKKINYWAHMLDEAYNAETNSNIEVIEKSNILNVMEGIICH